MPFPTVRGSDLSRRSFTLPADLEGELNVLLVPFQRWQQMEVDSWLPLVQELEQGFPNLRYYELPTIQRMNRLAHWFIDEGMRGGIPDPKARASTITLYLDKSAFRAALDMPDEDHIYVLLADREGTVHWRERGALTEEKARALREVVEGWDV